MTTITTLRCPNCAERIGAEAKFCPSCGHHAAGDEPRPSPGVRAAPTAPAQPTIPQPDFITLSCPTCGGKLQITSDLERFACAHCGNEHVVRRAGGVVSLAPLTKDVRQIRTGVDKTAAELAIARLTRELETLLAERQQAVTAHQAFLEETLKQVFNLAGLSLLFALIALGAIATQHMGTGVTFAVLTGLCLLGWRQTGVDRDQRKFQHELELKTLDAKLRERNIQMDQQRRILAA